MHFTTPLLASVALIGGVSALVPSQVNPPLLSAAPQLNGNYLPQASPSLPVFSLRPGVFTAYPTTTPVVTGPLSTEAITLTGYPEIWKIAPINTPEVLAAIATIDFSAVPAATVHKADAAGNLVFTGYPATDPYCWWSDTLCDTPKAKGLPPDIWQCPTPGTWGLTYDDGPLVPENPPAVDQWAEPNLYNFLAATNNQKATLFYIGSNIYSAPQAAIRGLNDGHVICVHTWSHNPMTTLTNQQVVAELYYTIRIIKDVLGITPKCWRPPYGDVDDRVRSIAWQMGLTTIIWDSDSNDWNVPPGGTLAPATVDGYFQGWINARKDGKDTKTGHVGLEHELNYATVQIAEKWLPALQQTFNVLPATACWNISTPYWEQNWVYPTLEDPSGIPVASSAIPSSVLDSAIPSASQAGSSVLSASFAAPGASSSVPSSILPAASAVSGTSRVIFNLAFLLVAVFCGVINL